MATATPTLGLQSYMSLVLIALSLLQGLWWAFLSLSAVMLVTGGHWSALAENLSSAGFWYGSGAFALLFYCVAPHGPLMRWIEVIAVSIALNLRRRHGQA
jgi:hypothetical protein